LLPLSFLVDTISIPPYNIDDLRELAKMRALKFILSGILIAGSILLVVFSFIFSPIIAMIFHSLLPVVVSVVIAVAMLIGGIYLMPKR
jgi:CBS domain containing-hemolysin-like protein